MIKRRIVFDNYDTAANGWVLASWKLTDAEEKTNFVEKPGGDGSWDLSTVLSDGIPRYRDRTLTATFERSDGNRLNRKAKIDQMINQLDGMRVKIELPDDPLHYLDGKLHVALNYNDLAHASVTVTAICAPWKYNVADTVHTLTASSTAKTVTVVNGGRRAVVPSLTVSGSGASVLLVYGSKSMSFTAGTYMWPDLLLTPGSHNITYSGTGTLKVTYREAVLS